MRALFGGLPQGFYRPFVATVVHVPERPSPFRTSTVSRIGVSLRVCPPVPLRFAKRQHRETPPNHALLPTPVIVQLPCSALRRGGRAWALVNE
jgi:hypothetical protein